MDSTTPSLGARSSTQGNPPSPWHCRQAGQGRPRRVPASLRTWRRATARRPRPLRPRQGSGSPVSIWVTVVTPRSMSVCVRSNWRRGEGLFLLGAAHLGARHVEGGARLGHACLGLRPAARVQKRGAERLDTRDHGLSRHHGARPRKRARGAPCRRWGWPLRRYRGCASGRRRLWSRAGGHAPPSQGPPAPDRRERPRRKAPPISATPASARPTVRVFQTIDLTPSFS